MRHQHMISIATRASLLAMLLVANSMSAQPSPQRVTPGDKPTGAEIALKARTARLDRVNVGKGEFQGKPITFTPALLPPRANLVGGQIIGILENEVAGDETGLPPGKYNVYAVRLEDGWHVYAESGGEIAREALRVELVRRPGQPAEKLPRIRPKGWGVDIDYSVDRTLNPPAVASISITGNQGPLLVGEQRQFNLELKDAAGNVLSGRTVSWTSSAPSVASAPSRAVTKGVAGGTATFTATSEGKSASITVQVPALTYAVSFSHARGNSDSTYTASIARGESYVGSVYVAARNCYWSACPAINPGELTISNSAPTIASTVRGTPTPYSYSLSAPLTVAGLEEGATDLTFAFRGVTHKVRLTVGRSRAASIAIMPTLPSVITGETMQLTATARDASGAVITTPVSWRSNTPAIADVTPSGRVAGIAAGFATLVASLDTVTRGVSVRVAPVPVASVAVTPAPVTVVENGFTALTATARDQAGNVLTNRPVVWTVNNPAIAEVTASGRVVGIAPGTAMVTATSEGRSGTAAVTVTADPASTDRLTETISFNW
jgi:uncharacterized protein YjdB